ncbi:YqjF family protein [Nocardioides sp. CFH 31398]|uniref:YqjF family protein n=1 Tax=Nocardioides sp. CFH 31398 TaxID=2919579 RepID=UPI001F06EF06|nr:DUF2071 domain-containing protein [Nocardioides sp. CFH 31398]MCH1866071.1 DUF2071 domain-containing protein [Nocardioides sp. CFH 31398]
MHAEPVTTDAPALPRPVVMSQDWRDLTFLHWAVDPSSLERFMPPGVRPDVHEGRSYVGLVPFRMVDAGFANGPAVPFFGTFLETNVRLYSVGADGRRGVVFLSLDTDRLAVVAGARAALRLPYRWASMSYRVDTVAGAPEHTYTARLRTPSRATSRLVVRVGERREATDLDVFLTARWGLHTRAWGRTLYVRNSHPAWPLHDAEAVVLDDGLTASVGLPGLADRAPDHVAFSPGVHTRFGRAVRSR